MVLLRGVGRQQDPAQAHAAVALRREVVDLEEDRERLASAALGLRHVAAAQAAGRELVELQALAAA